MLFDLKLFRSKYDNVPSAKLSLSSKPLKTVKSDLV